MATIEVVRRRLETARSLRSIVRAMKALATASIRQYEEAVASLADSARAVELGFQVLLRARPELLRLPPVVPQRIGSIVIGSDHGLCGAFNERIASFYVERRAARGEPPGEALEVAVGARVAGRFEDLGLRPGRVLGLPVSVARIAALVRELLEEIAAWRADGRADGVRLYFHAPHGRTGHRPSEELLLPLDETRLRSLALAPWRPRAAPTLAGDWEALFSAVVQQHLFVTLYRAVAGSLASENASRLAAMHAAERNIDDRLGALQGEFHRVRQDAITTELLDIVSGFETLVPERR